MAAEHILVLDTKQLKDPQLFQACLGKVSPERREQVERYAHENGKLQSLGAGLVLNQILEHFGLNPRETVLEYGDNNKPRIPNLPQAHFNLTHSGSFAAGAWGRVPVGIDIEQVGTMREGVARRFFHKGELLWLESLPSEEERRQGFFRLWVLKESFMKVTGLGMRLPLNAFEIHIQENSVRVSHQVDDKSYYFLEFELEGCRGAVCTEDQLVGNWGIEVISLR